MNKKTNKSISFQVSAELAMEVLAKQEPVSIEIARAQFRWLKEQSSSKTKKGEARIMKNLTKDQFKEVQQIAEQLKQRYPTYRKGQIFLTL